MPAEAALVNVTAKVVERLDVIQGGDYWTDHGGRVYAGDRNKIYHDDTTPLPYCVLLSEVEANQTDEFGAGGGDHIRTHNYSLVWRVAGEGDYQKALQRALKDTRVALARDDAFVLDELASALEIQSAVFDPPAQSSSFAELTLSLAVTYPEVIRGL